MAIQDYFTWRRIAQKAAANRRTGQTAASPAGGVANTTPAMTRPEQATNQAGATQPPSRQTSGTATGQTRLSTSGAQTAAGVPKPSDLARQYTSLAQQPVTPDAIVESPAYQAQAQAIDFGARQAQAALRRSLASRGMLRSTPAIQTLASSDAYYQAQQAALVPQMLQAATQAQQAQLQNLGSAIDLLTGLEDREYRRAVEEAGLTGRYLPPPARQAIQQVLGAKESYMQAAETGDQAAMDEARRRADAARAALRQYGVDPSQFGADVTLEQAQANVSQTGVPTIQGRLNELAVERQRLQNELARLETEIAKDPDVGLRAQAQAEMDRLRQQLAVTDAELQALQSGGGQEAAGPLLTPNQQVDAILAAARTTGQITPEQAQVLAQYGVPVSVGQYGGDAGSDQARQAQVKSYTSAYNITPMAADAWVDLDQALRELESAGQTPTWEQAQALKQTIFSGAPLPESDRAWLETMLASRYGYPTAAQALERYRKGYESPEESLTNMLQ